ncbi:MAG: hypothetical protein Q8P82_01745 [bacterium]|nr:hypothetical protein [bacterium]
MIFAGLFIVAGPAHAFLMETHGGGMLVCSVSWNPACTRPVVVEKDVKKESKPKKPKKPKKPAPPPEEDC